MASPWSSLVPADHDVRLVVADMDGTLLDAGGNVPESFWPLLAEMRARGIAFVPASGRQYATLARTFTGDGSAMSYIAENGNLVVSNGAVLAATSLDRAFAAGVIDAVRRSAGTTYDLGLVVCGRRSAYIERTDAAFIAEAQIYYAELATAADLHDIEDDILKLAIYDFGDAERSAADVLEPVAAGHQIVVSGQHWIDVMNREVNKGTAVRILQNALGTTPEQTAVFGDYLNDLEMLDTAELSFAMSNAHPALLDRARYLAPGNDEHGVVTVLRYLLG